MTQRPRSPFVDPRRWIGFLLTCALVCVGFVALSSAPEVDSPASHPAGHWSSLLPPLVAILLAGIGGYTGMALGLSIWTVYAFLVLGTLAVLLILGKPLPSLPVLPS